MDRFKTDIISVKGGFKDGTPPTAKVNRASLPHEDDTPPMAGIMYGSIFMLFLYAGIIWVVRW